jgi:hypothetical protein
MSDDDDSIEFPEPPEEYTNAKFTPLESLSFPAVPVDDEDLSVESLEQRLKRLNPSTTFTLKKPTLADVMRDDDADERKTTDEKVSELLNKFREEAALEGKDGTSPEDAEDAPVVKSKPKPKPNAVQKSMAEYLAAAAKAMPDNIFVTPNAATAHSDANANARAKARYDANQKRHNAKIAQQVLRDARDAGIDPREIDASQYEYAALDSDLEDDGDDSDSIELSSSE